MNRDFELIVMRDCVDTMDGEEAHRMALSLIETCLGRVLSGPDLSAALGLEVGVTD